MDTLELVLLFIFIIFISISIANIYLKRLWVQQVVDMSKVELV